TTDIITTCANILDDGDDTSFVRGLTITLTAGGRIGGSTPITTADVLSASTATPTANFKAAVDVAYGGTLSLIQTGALGNIQIRKVNSGLNTSSLILGNPLVG